MTTGVEKTGLGQDLSDERFAELDERLPEIRSRLEGSVRRVCPGWLNAQVDDLVQLAMIRLLDQVRKDGGIHRLGTYSLRKLAYSVTVDEMRRRCRRPEVQVGESAFLESIAPQSSDPERRARGREIGEAIVGCLARLIRPRRFAATLHLQGYTVPETARSLGWTTKKAEHLTYRGLADLRHCLERKGLRP